MFSMTIWKHQRSAAKAGNIFPCSQRRFFSRCAGQHREQWPATQLGILSVSTISEEQFISMSAKLLTPRLRSKLVETNFHRYLAERSVSLIVDFCQGQIPVESAAKFINRFRAILNDRFLLQASIDHRVRQSPIEEEIGRVHLKIVIGRPGEVK
jgi:hypothetical protein